jgi:hypothetical protein
VGVQGEQEPGTVIEPVDDFNTGPIGESPAGKEVGWVPIVFAVSYPNEQWIDDT